MNTKLFAFLTIALYGLSAVSAMAQTAEPLPYAPYYDPAKGFKPAQRDLTKVFLQLAGSLEHHGTPEPYIRHVLAEHARIAVKYKAATGKDNNSRPAYLTDAYVDKLLANWSKLEGSLKLESLCRKSGHNMRLAIMGTWNMPVSELVAQETGLTPKQAAQYRRFLSKPYFSKADFAELEGFYADAGGWNSLSESGKSLMSQRVHLGKQAPEQRNEFLKNQRGGTLVVKILNTHHQYLVDYLTTDSEKVVNSDNLETALKIGLKLDRQEVDFSGLPEYERDALQYSHAIKADFQKRFGFIDQNASSASDAKNIKAALVSMAENLVVVAHLEFRIGLVELSTR
jgi:hypothetical protein